MVTVFGPFLVIEAAKKPVRFDLDFNLLGQFFGIFGNASPPLDYMLNVRSSVSHYKLW